MSVYFQTGSGKTFTITGGAEKYVDRGLIPRSLSYIFEYFEKVSRKTMKHKVLWCIGCGVYPVLLVEAVTL